MPQKEPAPEALNHLTAGVEATLAATPARPEDEAMRALLRRYARVMDESAALAELAADIDTSALDDNGNKDLARLKAKVSAQQVMTDLGPKLLAALDALTATPKARTEKAASSAKAGIRALEEMRTAADGGRRTG